MTDQRSSDIPSITKQHITGLILSGGKGSRMGGADKGLVLLHNQRLIDRAVNQLRPQVAKLFLSCNRNVDTYKSLGHKIIQDEEFENCGPLSGIYNALAYCTTPYLAVIPVDSVAIPVDLVSRLATELSNTSSNPDSNEINRRHKSISFAHDGDRTQPLFMLIQTSIKSKLREYLASGERRTHHWVQQQDAVSVNFSDCSSDFININDTDTLKQQNEKSL